MPLPPQELAAIKKALNAARGGPVNFAVCLGTKPQTMIVLLDRSKTPRALMGVAKTQGDTNKYFCGDLEVDNNRAIFKCQADPASGALPQLKKFFEQNKLGFKPEFGTDLDDDIRDGVDKGSSMDAATEMSPELKKWRKLDAQIEAKVRSLMKQKIKPPSKGMAAWKELRKRAQRGEIRFSLQRGPKVLQLLEPPKDKTAPKKGEMIKLVSQMVKRLKGKMTPEQEKYLKAAAVQAKKGQDDKAAKLLRAVQKAA